jgi:hypothetical protein
LTFLDFFIYFFEIGMAPRMVAQNQGREIEFETEEVFQQLLSQKCNRLEMHHTLGRQKLAFFSIYPRVITEIHMLAFVELLIIYFQGQKLIDSLTPQIAFKDLGRGLISRKSDLISKWAPR